MEMSESTTALFKALNEIQKKDLTVVKDRVNPITQSKYATLDAILKMLLPLTSAQGLAVSQYPVTSNGMMGVQTLITHTSGEWVKYDPYFIAIGANKRMSQAQEGGSALTYAKRYQLTAIFAISADEDNDGNQQQPVQQPRQQATRQQQKKQPANAELVAVKEKANEHYKSLVALIGKEQADIAYKKAAGNAGVTDKRKAKVDDWKVIANNLMTSLMEAQDAQRKAGEANGTGTTQK